ncbi:D-alanine transaminase [Tangfeifania diversioriginum]|uniref:D-alanine aminotransferase n=1 Tax=Tangfeifania diversioriginum TaxID=1168035 RepID=A0A1M6EP01_9BACT|nr:D-amino-acid transaminase [Tangfeifania diversioriginum]SHI87153.1 D-alanine transaminase [Tangfeifania diversioriginum]
MSNTVYLNGKFVPEEEARISPNDRGFLFADGVYEVIKYYNGKPFRYANHIERLERSLREIRIDFRETGSLKSVFQKLLADNELTETHAGIYLQITRGAHRRIHSFPDKYEPTVYAFAFSLPSAAQNIENGIKVTTHEDIRWLRCDIKSVSLLPNTFLFNEAVENGGGECILIRNGVVTEATHSSVFGVKNGTVYTHPLSNLILPGITRKAVIGICKRLKIQVQEKAVSEEELFELDELFITGTGSEITPVIQVDDKPVGNKKPGGITRLIQFEFFKLTSF